MKMCGHSWRRTRQVAGGFAMAVASACASAPVSVDVPASSVGRSGGEVESGRVAVLPTGGEASPLVAGVLGDAVLSALQERLPDLPLLQPDSAAARISRAGVDDVRLRVFSYGVREASADVMLLDRLTDALGTPRVLDLRAEEVAVTGVPGGPPDASMGPAGGDGPRRALGLRLTMWASGEARPLWGVMALLPGLESEAELTTEAQEAVRGMVARIIAQAPIARSG